MWTPTLCVAGPAAVSSLHGVRARACQREGASLSEMSVLSATRVNERLVRQGASMLVSGRRPRRLMHKPSTVLQVECAGYSTQYDAWKNADNVMHGGRHVTHCTSRPERGKFLTDVLRC